MTVGRHELDNRWVVPYNPFVAARYDAHINVEVFGIYGVISHLYKYVYKGSDCADVEVEVSE